MTIDTDRYRAALATVENPDDIDALLCSLAVELEDDYETWLRAIFPSYVTASFAEHHRDFWRWAWSIRAGEGAVPFVAIWPRGGAKSTSVELACAAFGARGTRKYVLIVSDTQAQADDRVGNIGSMLESPAIAEMYPQLGERLVGKFGQSRGWRRDRLRTLSGFTVDGIGLDTAARGAKLDEDRPDLIVFDDIDDSDDSPKVTQTKIDALTRTFLPALVQKGGTVLAVQNLILPNGVFARIAGLADQPADFLTERVLSGPVPAARGLELGKDDTGLETFLGGEPVWEGQGPDEITRQVRLWGRTAFLVEAQHEVQLRSGGKFRAWDWMAKHWADAPMPDHAKRCRAWDQAGTEFDGTNDPDHTVGVRWAYDPESQLYRIEDVVRFRHSAGARDQIMRQVALEDAETYGIDGVAQLIERRPGDLGRDEADRIVREVWQGLRAQKVAPIGSKDDRADGLASAMENGLVSIVRQSPDLEQHRGGTSAFLAECEGFPLGDHDDQVDAAAHGFNWLRKRGEETEGSSAGVDAPLHPLRR